jgi:hypothetical protein
LIRYRPGKNNTLADALSQQEAVVKDRNRFHEQTLLPRECLDSEIPTELDEREQEVIASMDQDLELMDKLLQGNRTDPKLESYREKAKSESEDWTLENGLVLYRSRLLVPENDDLKVRLVDEAAVNGTSWEGKDEGAYKSSILLAKDG